MCRFVLLLLIYFWSTWCVQCLRGSGIRTMQHTLPKHCNETDVHPTVKESLTKEKLLPNVFRADYAANCTSFLILENSRLLIILHVWRTWCNALVGTNSAQWPLSRGKTTTTRKTSTETSAWPLSGAHMSTCATCGQYSPCCPRRDIAPAKTLPPS